MARVINVHTHIHPMGALERARQWGIETGKDPDGKNYLKVGDYYIHGIQEGQRTSAQLAGRVAEMDDAGVDVQVLTITPLFYLYWAEAAANRAFASLANEGLAEMAAAYPDRFWPAAHVPLQNVDYAVEELDRAVNQLGMRAVNIGVNVGGRILSDPAFDPFYERAQALDIPILIHPYPLGIDIPEQKWMQEFDLDWSWGYIFEESAAIVALIFGGVLDRFPGLRLMIPHGGGDIPFHIGRLEYLAKTRRGDGLQRSIRDYLTQGQLFYDTCLHDPGALKYMIDVMGVDNVVLGTNYPGWDHFPGWDLIRGLPGLTDTDREKILGGNAERRLFRPAASAAAGAGTSERETIV